MGGSRYLGSRQHSFEFLLNNSLISVNVFEELSKWRKPFIYSSSQMSNMMGSPYGLLKRLGEQFTHALEPFGTLVRFWNVYGVELSEEKSHAITDFVRMAITNHEIKMLTDGSEQRQFLFAADCAVALEVLMTRFFQGHHDKQIDISSFEFVSIRDVAAKVAKLARERGISANVVPGLKADVVQGDARNEPSRRILDFWTPKVSLEEGINEIFEFLSVQKQSHQ